MWWKVQHYEAAVPTFTALILLGTSEPLEHKSTIGTRESTFCNVCCGWKRRPPDMEGSCEYVE
jgi:hypothetical protein